MKKYKPIVLIGGIHLGHKPDCGETMKNQLFLLRFKELFDTVIPVDTFEWRRRPWCLITILYTLLRYPKAKVIISASGAAKHLINFLYKFPINRTTYFWVVGGDLPVAVKKGLYNTEALNNLVFIPVQGISMVKELKELGVNNAIYVPNSKPITYHPQICAHEQGKPYKFVFLSRIHNEKGIKEIAEASKMLNKQGYKGQYFVDFYGKKDAEFADEFDRIILDNDEFNYRGYLDLTSVAGYELLSSYDMMLFPTYWHGEGFPGVVLDAYIAGVPIIATDWNLNAEVIEDNQTGIIIPAHDSEALFNAMKAVIKGEIDLFPMKTRCLDYVQKFDFRNVLSKDLMRKLKFYE